MHRIDGDAHVANMFDEGDPGVPRNPTQITAKWLNAVQEEIANVVEAMGGTLSDATEDQLLTALTTVSRTNASLDPNWSAYTSFGFVGPRYYKDATGHVHLEGVAQHSTDGDGVKVFTLPSGFRPPCSMVFQVSSGSGGAGADNCYVVIETNGNVTPGFTGGGSLVYVHFHGISFHP